MTASPYADFGASTQPLSIMLRLRRRLLRHERGAWLGAAADCGRGWLENEVRVPNSRRRWDMAFRLGGRTVVVEYDGDEHYRNALKAKADQEKEQAAREAGHKIVRFPYWIQLDAVTLRHHFGLKATIEQDFPHGFITTKLFPASFCEIGVARFRDELFGLPTIVRDAVVQSLHARAAEYGIEFVVPSSCLDLLKPQRAT